jgi:hypothetical protein
MDDLLDGLDNNVTPTESLAQPGRKATGSKKKPGMQMPFSSQTAVNASKISKSANTTIHGQYKQITFRLPFEYLDKIEEIAIKEGLSKEETKRWLVGTALKAYQDGERPDIKPVTRNKVSLPGID